MAVTCAGVAEDTLVADDPALKKIVKLEDDLPRVLLAGARAFPPEDCGGTWGYESCVEIATGVAEPSSPWQRPRSRKTPLQSS
jgi:hypothetical protein